MFYVEYENKIILADADKQKIINTLNLMPQYKNCEIKETDAEIENFMFVGGEIWRAWKTNEMRHHRDMLLAAVVDPVISNHMRWGEMPADEQQKYLDYRRYLLDITQDPMFPMVELKTFEEFTA